MTAVLYIHGKDGSAAECEHYKALFPNCHVTGLDYRTATPWETGPEIREAVEALRSQYDRVILIANSVGAFFTMHAGVDELIKRAYFISPVADMEQLIGNLMIWAGVTEAELEEKGMIPTDFGEDLSWDYLCYVRAHPIRWSAPTHILYGGKDILTSRETITRFVEAHGATLTVMEEGEHWFHTEAQMTFLDKWIMSTNQ